MIIRNFPKGITSANKKSRPRIRQTRYDCEMQKTDITWRGVQYLMQSGKPYSQVMHFTFSYIILNGDSKSFIDFFLLTLHSTR